MTNKLMYIPNDDTQNYPFCRLKLVFKRFKNSTKRNIQSKFTLAPKVVLTTNKKTLLKNFEDYCN